MGLYQSYGTAGLSTWIKFVIIFVLCSWIPSSLAGVLERDVSSTENMTNGNGSSSEVSDTAVHHHFIIGIISDNDEKSKSVKKPKTWESKFVRGKLIWDDTIRHLAVEFDIKNTKVLRSGFNSEGRGMELSELIYYDSVLTAFDDKTGIVYKIENGEVFPWVILASGNGKINKGFKSEWATVKEDKLIVGSHGTTKDTDWIKIISPSGVVEHVNWTEHYAKLMNISDCGGYLTHEAVCWSEIHGKWFFLPRKCSKEPYSLEDSYNMKSSNILISTDENFQNFRQAQVGMLVPAQGFSSFKFLPDSNDTIIVALKTIEVNSAYKTHITAFTIEGEILLEDTLISDGDKFEGLEFIHPYDPILKYVAPEPSSASLLHLQFSGKVFILGSTLSLLFFNLIKL
uniref:Apyrase n=1 Tax=Cacopsylla melanoneura TaxID=428564 RepID=A0A8D8TWE0_9HEMI